MGEFPRIPGGFGWMEEAEERQKGELSGPSGSPLMVVSVLGVKETESGPWEVLNVAAGS